MSRWPPATTSPSQSRTSQAKGRYRPWYFGRRCVMNACVPGRAFLAAIVTILLVVGVAGDAVPLTRISTDPYSGGGSQHATEDEPDTFAAHTTVVAQFQVGSFIDGGSSNTDVTT